MRFLQIVTVKSSMSGPPDRAHMAKVKAATDARIASGALVATGALGKRATGAARVIQENGEIRVEDPPAGDGWMAGGGYTVDDHPSKTEAIARAKEVLASMGDGVVELIEVSPMYPAPKAAADAPPMAGVVPYLTMDDAAAASDFYQQAFGAREIARMPAEDGKRVMHCHLEINGGALMLSDNFPEFGLPAVQCSHSYTMQLIVTEGDRWWKRALGAGCTELMPFAIAPWGDKYGQLSDPFGVRWAINEPAQGSSAKQ